MGWEDRQIPNAAIGENEKTDIPPPSPVSFTSSE